MSVILGHRYNGDTLIPPDHYQIYNHRTGNVVGKTTTKAGANRSVDRNDNKYGGYAHSARPVYKDSFPATESRPEDTPRPRSPARDT
jgi:hypothetical protein